MAYSYRPSATGLNFAETGQILFDVEASDFDVLTWTYLKSETSVTEGAEETSLELASSTSVEGNYGMFSASVQANLERYNSESVQTVRVSKKTRAEKYRVTPGFADPWNRLKSDAKQRMLSDSPQSIVSFFGEFYAESMTMGGQFETMHVMEKTESESKTSLALELEASYSVVLVGSVSGSSQNSMTETRLVSNYSMRTSWHVSGGDSILWLGLTEDNIGAIQAQWAASVTDANLFPIKIRFAPLWKLLEPHDAAKASQLEAYLVEKWARDLSLLPDYLPAGFLDQIALRRQQGFSKIYDMAFHAGWYSANLFAGGLDNDAAQNLAQRDTSAIQMGYDWSNSTLQPMAQTLKWMAQDYAWYCVNNLWNGHNTGNSHDFANYVQHREEAKRVLNGAGAPPDELFWRINNMITELVWVPARARHNRRRHTENYGPALAHWAGVQEQLATLLADKGWPLFDQ